MSVESLAIALHHSRSTGTARIVLLGIANHDGDGGSWPSVATLARYARVHPRNVQKALTQLERLHEITRELQAGGRPETADPRRPNLYTFRLTCPPDCDRSRHHRTARSLAPLPAPLFEWDTGGDIATRGAGAGGGVALAPPEPIQRTQPIETPAAFSRKQPRARASCGHLAIDDRHCEWGCPVAVAS